MLSLDKYGIAGPERDNIIGTFTKFQESAKNSGINLNAVVRVVDGINNEAENELAKTFGSSKSNLSIDGNTYNLTMDMVLSQDKPVSYQFVNSLADTWVNLMRDRNGSAYRAAVKLYAQSGWDINNLARDLTDYSISKRLETMAGAKGQDSPFNVMAVQSNLFGSISKRFKPFVNNLVKRIQNVRQRLFRQDDGTETAAVRQQFDAFAGGDWSSIGGGTNSGFTNTAHGGMIGLGGIGVQAPGSSFSLSNGVSDTKQLKPDTVRQIEHIVSVSKKVSAVEWFEDDTKVNGYYDPVGRTIHINRNSQKPHIQVLGHELWHSLSSEEQSRLISLFVRGASMDSVKFREYKDKTVRTYQKYFDETGRGKFTDRMFLDEFGAENAAALLTNPEFAESIYGDAQLKSKNIFQKILAWIRDMWRRLTGKSKYKRTEAAAAADVTENALVKAEKIFSDMLGVEPAINVKRRGADEKNSNAKFSLGKTVEEIRNLIAVHNLSAGKLTGALELDGLPMPSIAITKSDIGFDDFGDITLVFSKDSISPADKRNKIYGADAWTPTIPQVGRKADKKVLEKIYGRFAELQKERNFPARVLNIFEPQNLDGLLNARDFNEALSKDSNIEMLYLFDTTDFKPVIDKDGKPSYYDTRDAAHQIMQYDGKYMKWIEDVFNGVVEKKGIKNNKDLFTPSGNRRSFEQLYDSYTLDNIIKIMSKGQQTGVGAFGGSNAFMGASAKQYKSIDDIRADRDRITKIEAAEYDKIRDEFSNELLEIADSMLKDSPARRSFNAVDDAVETIIEAVGKSKKSDAVYRYIKQWDGVFNITPEIAAKIAALSMKASEIPVSYLEAKPKRAVAFNEIKAAIVPDDLDKSIVQKLADKGVRVIEYDKTKSGSRLNAINSVDDVKFSLDVFDVQDIEIKKPSGMKVNPVETTLRAHLRPGKVYTVREAANVASDIVSAAIVNPDSGLIINKKDMRYIAGLTHKLMNVKTGRGKLIDEIAANIIDKARISETDYDFDYYEDVYNTLKGFKNKLKFTPEILSEIKNMYGDEAAKGKALFWSAGANGGIAADSAYMELASMFSSVFPEDVYNIGDQTLLIFETYNDILDMKSQPVKYLRDIIDSGSYNDLTGAISEGIKTGLTVFGTDSKIKRQHDRDMTNAKNKLDAAIDKYRGEIEYIREANADKLKKVREKRDAAVAEANEKARAKITKIRNRADEKLEYSKRKNKVKNLFRKIHDINGAYKKHLNGIDGIGSHIKDLVELVGRGYNETYDTFSRDFRERIRDYTKWYSNQFMGEDGDPTLQSLYEQMVNISAGSGNLKYAELGSIENILSNFIHVVKNYDEVRLEGKRFTLGELAEKGIGEASQAMKTGAVKLPFDQMISSEMVTLTNPKWQFLKYGNYDDSSVMAKMYYELQGGQEKMWAFKHDVTDMFSKYFKEHRNEVKKWRKQDIELGSGEDGNPGKLSTGQVISLYFHSRSLDNVRHILASPVRVTNESETKDYKSAVSTGRNINFSLDDLVKAGRIVKEKYLEYVELVEKFFTMSRDAKIETDMALYGVSNVIKDFYFPIEVLKDTVNEKLGVASQLFNEMNSVFGLGFNKNRTQNAANPIVLSNILNTVNKHNNLISSYSGLAQPVRSVLNIYNRKIGGKNLKMVISEKNDGFTKYLSELLVDVQGANRQNYDYLSKFSRALRGNTFLTGLGLNVGMFKQLSSVPMAFMYVEPIHLAYGVSRTFNVNWEELDKYVPAAWYRNNDGAASEEMGFVNENKGIEGKVALTTAGYGFFDRRVMGILWNAVKHQVESKGAKPGTDEFYEKASRLMGKVIYDTQDNHSALQRSAIMRSPNEIPKMFTMFMSSSLQNMSLLTAGTAQIRQARYQYKKGIIDKAEYSSRMKNGRNFLIKAITSIVLSWTLAALFGLGKSKLSKPNDEKKVLEDFMKDFLMNIPGMFPLIRDIVSIVDFEGYGTLSEFDGLAENIANIVNGTKSLISAIKEGDTVKIPQQARKTVLGIAGITGMPLRNLETDARIAAGLFRKDLILEYDRLINPNLKISTRYFYGEKIWIGKIEKLNDMLEAESKDPIALPTKYEQFINNGTEYKLTLSERGKYEAMLKQEIEKRMSEVDFTLRDKPSAGKKARTAGDIKKDINAVVNASKTAVQKAMLKKRGKPWYNKSGEIEE